MPKWAYFLGKVGLVIAGAVLSRVPAGRRGDALRHPLPAGPDWLTFAWVSRWAPRPARCSGIAVSGPGRRPDGRGMVTPFALVLQFISGVFFEFNRLPAWMQRSRRSSR